MYNFNYTFVFLISYFSYDLVVKILVMKKIFFISVCLFQYQLTWAQNVGIDVAIPKQKLDVNGAIKIGTSSTNNAGSIRYNNNSFEGGDGSTWTSLEGLPSKGIILAQEPDTAVLKTKGFSVLRTIDIWDTSYITVPTNFPGSWTNGFPIASGTTPTSTYSSQETVMYNGSLIYYGQDAFLRRYNTATDIWDILPNISPLGVRQGCGVTLVGNEIFVTGGWRFVNPSFVFYNTSAKYNLLTNVWTTIAPIPVNNAYHVTIAAGSNIYLLNGSSTSTFTTSVKLYQYNTLTNTWSANLSTASTPPEVFQGESVSRNGKFLLTNRRPYFQGGTTYISVIEYDPVSHTITFLTPIFPANGQTPITFSNHVITLSGSKVNIAAVIPDTTNVNYNPLVNPQSYSNTMTLHYEVDLATGVAVQLSTCQLDNIQLGVYQYSAGDNRFYGIGGSNQYFVFNRSGAQACNTILNRKGFWSYMKKN